MLSDDHVIRIVLAEVNRARKVHPLWPTDPIHAAAIVAEESGELVRASLRVTYEGGTPDEITREAMHTAATCIRLLAKG